MLEDRAWLEAWDALLPVLRSSDRILLPAGSWPEAPVSTVRQYADRIDIADANILLLHKARLGTLPRQDLARVCAEWTLIYANDVFVCLARDLPSPSFLRRRTYLKHFRPVRYYLEPRSFRRTKRTIYFVHIPKTAGTTAWDAITRPVKAKIYYDSNEAFRANPPAPHEYDIVGGHVFRSTFEQASDRKSTIACILRDPVARVRSAFLHARRRAEDPSTFSPTMRLMRDLPLAEFLEHPDAKVEANMQLLMLGAPSRRIDMDVDSPEFQIRARAAIDCPRNIIMTTPQLETFIRHMRKMLGVRPLKGPLPRLNSFNPEEQRRDLAEFESLSDRVRTLAAPEYDLYRRLERSADAEKRLATDLPAGQFTPSS
jgi:hypothetical protein